MLGTLGLLALRAHVQVRRWFLARLTPDRQLPGFHSISSVAKKTASLDATGEGPYWNVPGM